MPTEKIKPLARCPACLKTGLFDPASEPGHTVLCIGCGSVNIFTADMSLRAIRVAEFEALPFDTRRNLKIAQRAIGSFQRRTHKMPD